MRLSELVRSNRNLIKKGLIGLGLATGLSLAAAAPASAEPYWHHGIYGPRLYPSAGFHPSGYHYGYGFGYRPFFPRPYIYAPSPVYYAPPPVYYAPPAPAYYAPAYYAPRPFIGVGIGLPPLVFRIH